MATPPEGRSLEPSPKTRWLWLVEASALISTVYIGMVALWWAIVTPWGSGGLLLAPLLVPYVLILTWVGRTGERQRRAVSLGLVAGWAGVSGTLVGLLAGDAASLWLGASQAALVLGTKRAHRAIKLQTGDRRPLAHGVVLTALGVLLFFGMVCVSVFETSPVGLKGPGMHYSFTASSLQTINKAEATYADTYKARYSPSLTALGPPPDAAQPSPSAAGLIDSVLASGVKSGYTFTYVPGPPDKTGHIKGYTVVARPLVEYGRFGWRRFVTEQIKSYTGVAHALELGNLLRRSFFTDESGVIRWTDEDRPATAKDPPIGG